MQWEKGTELRRIDNPGKIGIATGQVRPRGGLNYYSIRWPDGSHGYVAEDQLEEVLAGGSRDPYELITAGRYGRAEDLRRSLTHVHLSGRLANLVYSMGITNTDFYAHQYKPLLTLLESPADGLLIADEVGLGKTIEAGIIWTELRAREDMRRLLIVCPAMLREKWRDELQLRFGIDAVITDAATLANEMAHASRTGGTRTWIASYQTLRPPKSWRPGEEKHKARSSDRQRLADLLDEHTDDEPLLDLVVFDEAHYMRNPDSAAHQLGQLLLQVSHRRVLLSATPINLANEDLYHLLRLCDPEHFQYPSSFHDMLVANQPLVAARDAALRQGSTAEEILQHIHAAAQSTLLRSSRQLAALLAEPPTPAQLGRPEYRAELAATLERINLLGHVITRTRKRDVQIDRPRRIVHTEKVPMTEAETRFYLYVTEITRDYAWRRGLSDGFLLATPQRQVCSCPAAFARAWLADDMAFVDELAEHVAEELEDADDMPQEEISTSLKDFLVANRPRDLDARELELSDSKLRRLLEVLGDYFTKDPDEKVILFTSFRITARYLHDRLSESGMPAMLLWGNMAQSKQELINVFRESPGMRVLVCTEVAAEGVDLQFCSLLINYDLPWNPMRVEQRIGRIDRLGQRAEAIHIWNLFYEGTIDEQIFSRLLSRLRIFEETLGEPEPVIGETIQKLESALLTKTLTAEQEEQEIERARQALENVRQRQEELEKNAAQMIAHGGLVLDRIAAAKQLSRRVTEEDLIVYVRDFLNRYAPGHQFKRGPGSDDYEIRLPPSTAAELDEFSRRNGILGQTALGNALPRQCRFINQITAADSKSCESVHQFHPLIRFISEKLKQSDEAFFPVVSVALDIDGEIQVAAGTYVFMIHRWTFRGVTEEEWLQTAACGLLSQDLMDSDKAESLINLIRLRGRDWLEAAYTISAEQAAECLDVLAVHLDQAFERAKKRKQDENADRLMFQLHGVDEHLRRSLATLEEVRERHAALNRPGLVRATQGRIDKLCARIGIRRAQILQREKVIPDSEMVCAGLLYVRGAGHG